MTEANLVSYVYVAATVLLTVYGQVVVKWQVSAAAAAGGNPADRAAFLLGLLLNPWVLSALAAAFGAALCWMLAMTKLDLSHAYPFVSLSFVLVLFLSALFFGEPLSWAKALGVALIVAGVAVGSQG
jgi:drug/metabolite transporter (DMT)-like permease